MVNRARMFQLSLERVSGCLPDRFLRMCVFFVVVVVPNASRACTWYSRHNWIYVSCGFSLRSVNCCRAPPIDIVAPAVCMCVCMCVCVFAYSGARELPCFFLLRLADACVGSYAVCVCGKHLRKLEKYIFIYTLQRAHFH